MHGFSPEIQIFIICVMVLLWVVGALAAVSIAFNCYLAFSSRRRKPWLVALSAVVSAVSAGALTVGGFTLHPNAPYDKNWICLTGAIVVAGASVAAIFRQWKLVKPIVQPEREDAKQ